ncbi:MAG: DUF5615 family PIN-like protein [Roseiarcus sp.]
MKLLVDMNLSPHWTFVLRRAGFECEHWSHLGAPDGPDAELFAFAAREGWTIFTHDLDFGAMLAATRGIGPSVVQIRADDLRPEAVAPFLITALRQAEADLAAGALVTVEPARARIRILPLSSFFR